MIFQKFDFAELAIEPFGRYLMVNQTFAGDKPSRAAKRGASGVAGCGDTARATDKKNE
jgi:hypothetical protein